MPSRLPWLIVAAFIVAIVTLCVFAGEPPIPYRLTLESDDGKTYLDVMVPPVVSALGIRPLGEGCTVSLLYAGAWFNFERASKADCDEATSRAKHARDLGKTSP
jgi:hypothetical protein